MPLLRALARGLKALFRRRAADQDVEDEVEHYLAEATHAGIARGLSPDQARRAARIELGSPTSVREEVRTSGWEHFLETMLADLRYAIRRLRHNPGFALLSIATLALGIGASTAIFSAVNPILFRPLPYPAPDRILAVWDQAAGPVTFGNFRELTLRSRSFEATAALKPWQPVLTGPEAPERLTGQRVSAGYFSVLGVRPVQGRDFEPGDDVLNGPPVAILSNGLWRRRFGGDPGLVGKTITLSDRPYQVIGVLPPSFENVLALEAAIWAPLQYDAALPADGREWGHHLRMIGRLRAGVSPFAAGEELTAIANAPLPQFHRQPWSDLSNGLTAHPLQDDITRPVRPALLAVLGAVLLLLTMACVNVASMLLASGARRQGEFALRAALGAPRARVVRQLLVESLLLAGAGGALGLPVAQAGLQGFLALVPAELPRAPLVRLDGTAFAFAFGVALVAGLCSGLVPALAAGRADPRLGPGAASRGTTAGHQAARRGLVVAEVALALVLLTGAGLLVRSVSRLLAVASGFASDHVLSMQVYAAARRYESPDALEAYFDEVLEAARRVPGVAEAGFTSQLPLSGDFEKYGVAFESKLEISDQEDQSAFRYAVTPGYFAALRIPALRGRLLDRRDDVGAVNVLINASLARRRFPQGDGIGQRLHLGSTDQPWYTVVGIVPDVKQGALSAPDGDAVYLPARLWYASDRIRSLVVRTRGKPALLAASVRTAVWSVDRDQPVDRIATMDELVARSEAQRRFALLLFEVFAAVALLLAAIGIYGVLSGSVAERTREIGVRTALGATREGILGLVLRQGMGLTGLGVMLGLGGAYAATKAIETLLFGVSRLDLVTYLGVVGLLGAVALAACWLPARRAARIDPVITLKSE